MMWPFSRWHKRIEAAEAHHEQAQQEYVRTVLEDERIDALTKEARRTHARLSEQDKRNHFTDTLFGIMGRQY